MAALPYMPLYVADYLADASHLSTVQHGAYLLLLMNYWQRGEPLPNDDVRLARIARMTNKEWARNRDVICEFFSIDENLWRHRRVDSELAHVLSKSLKSKKAAQASVQQRFGVRSTSAERPLNHTDTDTRSKSSVDKSTGTIVPILTSDQTFWANGKTFLKPESKDPGAVIGKWCQQYGKEAVASALTRAQLERPVERIPFIVGCLKHKASTDSDWSMMP